MTVERLRIHNPTPERIASSLCMSKLVHAAQYRRLAKAMTAFNHGYAQRLAKYAAEDEAQAEILAIPAYDVGEIFLDVTGLAVVAPLDPELDTSGGPTSLQKEAIFWLTCAEAVEKEIAGLIKHLNNYDNGVAQKSMQLIDNILTTEALELIGKQRFLECEKMIKAIESGRIFEADKPIPHYCARCGYKYVEERSFETCWCCNAPQQFCVIPFEYL